MADTVKAHPLSVPKLARRVSEILSAYNAASCHLILRASGIWDTLINAGIIPQEEKPLADQETAESLKRNQLLDTIYARAMKGDSRAAHDWLELSGTEVSQSAFDVCVQLVPYRIADKSLSSIVFEADEDTVRQMLDSIVRRCRVDNAPEALSESMASAFAKWQVWARNAYRHVSPREFREQKQKLDQRDVDVALQHMIEITESGITEHGPKANHSPDDGEAAGISERASGSS